MEELFQAVKNMRQLQKEYFRTRDKAVMAKSIAAEKEVDRILEEIDNPGLF